MHEFMLEEGGSSSEYLPPLLKEIAQKKQTRVRVYQLRFINGFEFIFQTTSKDVFLNLGLFSARGIQYFANLIQDELTSAGQGENQCLITTSESGKGLLVTRITSGNTIIFNLAQAH